MLLVQSSSSTATKAIVLMCFVFLLMGGIAWWILPLTMHVYVRPKPPVPHGFRIFGISIRSHRARDNRTSADERPSS